MPRIFTDIDDTILKDGQPVERVIDYIDETAEEVVVLTNRPESDREKTVADLAATGLEYQELIMNDGTEEAPAFKARIIKERLDAGEAVDLFIDNRADNREAVAALGVEGARRRGAAVALDRRRRGLRRVASPGSPSPRWFSSVMPFCCAARPNDLFSAYL